MCLRTTVIFFPKGMHENDLVCFVFYPSHDLFTSRVKYFVQFRFELWEYYEETFGKTGDMAPSEYLRITATNMKAKKDKKRKR
jgi:hypothetical protein